MGKSRKDYEKFLNSISPDRDDETWIIGSYYDEIDEFIDKKLGTI